MSQGEYALRARRIIEAIGENYVEGEGLTETTALIETLNAQTLAVLAVAEQLRIGNLIPLAKAPDGPQGITPGFSDRAHDLLTGDPGIAAALGVTAKEAKK